MKSINILLVVMLVCLVLPLTSAETKDPIQVNVSSNLNFLCTVNYGIPSNSATFNITVIYPNQTTYLSNVQANALGQGAFNYTIAFPITGNWQINQFCYDGTNGNYSNSDTYPVTPAGTINQTAFYFIIIAIAVGLIGLGFWKEDYWVIIIGGFVLTGFGIYVYLYGLDIYKNTTTDIISACLAAIGLYFTLRGAIEQLREGFG